MQNYVNCKKVLYSNIRKFNCDQESCVVKKVKKDNEILKSAKRKMSARRKSIFALEKVDGTVTKINNEIVIIVGKLYNDLYNW